MKLDVKKVCLTNHFVEQAEFRFGLTDLEAVVVFCRQALKNCLCSIFHSYNIAFINEGLGTVVKARFVEEKGELVLITVYDTDCFMPYKLHPKKFLQGCSHCDHSKLPIFLGKVELKVKGDSKCRK